MKNSMAAAADPARSGHANSPRTDEVGKSAIADVTITCPVCGAPTVQEKCKIICRSDVCRGRVILNCSEF